MRLVQSLLLAALLFAPAGEGSEAEPSGPNRGIVLERLQASSALERAGLRPGDVIVGWTAVAPEASGGTGAGGALGSPFDLHVLANEAALQGALTLRGFRQGAELEIVVSPGAWEGDVRPVLGREADLLYLALVTDPVDPRQSAVRLREAAAAADGAGRHSEAAWLYYRAALLHQGESALEEGRRDFSRAFESLRAGGKSAAAAWLMVQDGIYSQRRGGLSQAVDSLEVALELASAARRPLLQGLALHHLATMRLRQGAFEVASERFGQTLELFEGHAPESLAMSRTLNNMGALARLSGDLASAEDRHREAVRIAEAIEPSGIDASTGVFGLANVLFRRGDLASAQQSYEQFFEIRSRLAPDSPELAAGLNNLGNVAYMRGDLVAADGYYQRALEIDLRHSPGSLDVAMNYHNLAAIAEARGDFERAEKLNLFALGLRREIAPDSPDVALSLNNLGVMRLKLGQLEESEAAFQEALAMRERLSAGGLDVAYTLHGLGNVVRDRGDGADAERFHRRALQIRRERAPNSLPVSESLAALGYLALGREDPAGAESFFQEVVEIRDRLAPNSLETAEAYHQLALIALAKGLPAENLLLKAIDALDGQQRRLGGATEIRSRWSARNSEVYRHLVDLLVDSGDNEAAFHVLERSRARSLLGLLSERDLVFEADLPEELERRRRLANAAFDRAQQGLADPSIAADPERVEALRLDLERIRSQQREVQAEVRRRSPRLAALQYPEALDLERARAVLDPGTTLLSYSVGEGSTRLFVVSAARFEVITIEQGSASLRARVEAFRDLILKVDSVAGAGVEWMPTLEDLGMRLYDELVRPAETTIEGSERLLVAPDGPLHLLPFGALVRKSAQGHEYLIEWKPLHMTLSATLFKEIKRRRREGTGERQRAVVAFGDPRYPSVESGDQAPTLRAVTKSGGLTPLAAARQEVLAFAELMGGGVQLYLGSQATEARAKGLSGPVQALHFAVHGLLDEEAPLESALALSTPSETTPAPEDGFLQAWEIFEQLRIDADLVTLSACETALGENLAGEGLLGLTRAFQYAGARSVVATLWEVSDETTAQLMTVFYRHLSDGLTKDEALRRAQTELIHAPIRSDESSIDASAPLFWAGFQLTGDWR